MKETGMVGWLDSWTVGRWNPLLFEEDMSRNLSHLQMIGYYQQHLCGHWPTIWGSFSITPKNRVYYGILNNKSSIGDRLLLILLGLPQMKQQYFVFPNGIMMIPNVHAAHWWNPPQAWAGSANNWTQAEIGGKQHLCRPEPVFQL